DHHRVAPRLTDRHSRVHAAVVELDPLADPVRPRAEDDDRLPGPPAHLVRGLARGTGAEARGTIPAGVVVGSARAELGGPGVTGAERALAGAASPGLAPP